VAVAACVVASVGCKSPPEPPKKRQHESEPAERPPEAKAKAPPEGVRVEIGNDSPSTCRRTLCIGGPGELDSVPHRDLGELCRRAPGVVQRCEGERCANVWAFDDWQTGLDGLITSLDQNGDGKVDPSDRACPISLAGWSTGATVVARELPKALAADPRIDPGHAKVDNLVAIAPQAPGAPDPEQLDIADTVAKAFVYRYSKSPDSDCSREFEGGPWLSPKPVCAEGTRCFDYDYSKDPGDLAYISRRGARSGAEVGHCVIVSLVAKIGLDNLARGQESYSQLIPPYSDGSHGGREYVPGPAKPDPIRVLPNPVQPD
jgi:hypothetical protein